MKIFNGIILLSDIDGTFLNKMGDKVRKNLEAVEYFKENGGIFTFATGRYEQGDLVQEMKNIPNSPGIYTNGSYIYDFKTESIIYKQCLDGKEIIDTIYTIKEKYPQVAIRYTSYDGLVFFEKRGENIATYDWFKIVMIGKSETLDKIRTFITDIYGDKYAYSKSDSTLFEILDKDATKGKMTKYLHKYLNDMQGRKLKLYAIGDYENDIPMLRYADVSACPANALDMVKNVCDITVCDNNNGAVADFIYKIEKIEGERKHG